MKSILAILLSFAFVGCALFGGGREIERNEDYKVTAPTNWVSTSTGGESDAAYRLESGSIATITSSCHKNRRAGLETLTRQLLIGARQIRYDRKEIMTVSGDEGMLSRVRAQVEGRPFHLVLFVLPKEKCVFDFSLVNPKPISESDVNEFLTFIRSFKNGTN